MVSLRHLSSALLSTSGSSLFLPLKHRSDWAHPSSPSQHAFLPEPSLISHLWLLTVPGMIETNCPWRRSWMSSMFPVWTPPRAASPSTPGFRYGGGDCDLGVWNTAFQAGVTRLCGIIGSPPIQPLYVVNHTGCGLVFPGRPKNTSTQTPWRFFFFFL